MIKSLYADVIESFFLRAMRECQRYGWNGRRQGAIYWREKKYCHSSFEPSLQKGERPRNGVRYVYGMTYKEHFHFNREWNNVVLLQHGLKDVGNHTAKRPHFSKRHIFPPEGCICLPEGGRRPHVKAAEGRIMHPEGGIMWPKGSIISFGPRALM